MSKEFIRTCAEAHAANDFSWAETNMGLPRYSIVTGAMMLVLVQCGYAVYHLSLMAW
jgi:hypothetical protein